MPETAQPALGRHLLGADDNEGEHLEVPGQPEEPILEDHCQRPENDQPRKDHGLKRFR
jgi:hypothetical protein